MAVKSYRELLAWQLAMNLAGEVYRITARFPKDEMYGLTNQVRRAAVSVPSNIAEGQGRGANIDFCRFLRVAQGSLQEVTTQLLLAECFGFIRQDEPSPVMDAADELGRVLRGLSKSLPTTN